MFSTQEDLDMLASTLRIMQKVYISVRDLDPNEAVKGLHQMPELARQYGRKDGKDTRLVDIVAEQMISLGDDAVGHLPN